MLGVVAPFLALRSLVMASPVWYPALPATVRHLFLAFTVAVLESESLRSSKGEQLLLSLDPELLSRFG